MFQKEFEDKFDEYLATPRYKAAQESLYPLVRTAFLAGWLAAGGEKPRITAKPIPLEISLSDNKQEE